jgi:hypothetical protein
MACRITELVLDCREPELLARFWCEVLGFVVLVREGDDIEIGPPEGFGGLQPTLVLSRSEEPKNGKLRLHFDVNATDRDQEAELQRLQGRSTLTSGRAARNRGTCSPTLKGTNSACSGPASPKT